FQILRPVEASVHGSFPKGEGDTFRCLRGPFDSCIRKFSRMLIVQSCLDIGMCARIMNSQYEKRMCDKVSSCRQLISSLNYNISHHQELRGMDFQNV
ncbi:hypothetical protein L9F63_011927, partial [Diploptera punctata]